MHDWNGFSKEQTTFPFFFKHKSTYNSLHDIQEDTKKTFENKQVLGLVALDIAKTYDTTWHPNVI